jgi:hypothetical protein
VLATLASVSDISHTAKTRSSGGRGSRQLVIQWWFQQIRRRCDQSRRQQTRCLEHGAGPDVSADSCGATHCGGRDVPEGEYNQLDPAHIKAGDALKADLRRGKRAGSWTSMSRRRTAFRLGRVAMSHVAVLVYLVVATGCRRCDGGSGSEPLPVPTASVPPGAGAPTMDQDPTGPGDSGTGLDPLVEPFKEELTAFLQKLQEAVRDEDRQAVADLVEFTIGVSVLRGREFGQRTLDRSTFVRFYNEIVTPCIRRQVLASRIEDMVSNYQGWTIDGWQVWFTSVQGEDGGTAFRIMRFNNRPERCLKTKQDSPGASAGAE